VFTHEANQERKIMKSTRPHHRVQVQSHPRAKASKKESPLRARWRLECQTLDETQLNGVLSQINPTFGLEAES